MLKYWTRKLPLQWVVVGDSPIEVHRLEYVMLYDTEAHILWKLYPTEPGIQGEPPIPSHPRTMVTADIPMLNDCFTLCYTLK
jgi:hypothetical protein